MLLQENSVSTRLQRIVRMNPRLMERISVSMVGLATDQGKYRRVCRESLFRRP